MTSLFSDRLRPPSSLGLEAGMLLSRYPDLDSHEREQLVDLYRRLPFLEVSLLAADPRLGPRLESFLRDHEGRLPAWGGHRHLVLAVIALLAFGLAWLAVS